MSSKPENTTEDNRQDEALPVVRSAAFTLAAKKLAGSGQCLNCGTDLKGPFCYYCGQPDRNFMRFFPALLRDLMEDVLDFDSRFMRTMKPLLFKPGCLTRDYMEGRRFRYTPPMRLYIFSSIVFFLLAAFLSSDAVSIKSVKNDGDIVQVTTETAVQQEKVEEALEKLPENIRPQVNVVEVLEESRQEDDDSGAFKIDDIQFNEEPWDRETNPVDIKWLPGWLNDRINEEIEESPQKAEQINENPNLIIDKVFDILPATMFVLLPVVALIFKFWYLFAKRYYVEHLIFSLHNHSFVFVSLFLILLANVAISMLNNSGDSAAATGMEWLVIVISVWIPLYLLVSLRVVYQQNWFMTIGKFSVIGISYLTLLTFVTSGVAIASFVLL
ncbi:MAG: DUF3667 domain-containing protein [Xanthomonadales bacterium]|nr:DUF3667 domain-containing protein [Xanthomonadales bacterium]